MQTTAARRPHTPVMTESLPQLSTADLETLLAALDPLLDGFGDGASCLDDARAFLHRLGGPEAGAELAEAETSPLLQWLDAWRDAGGNRATLRLMVATLLQERQT